MAAAKITIANLQADVADQGRFFIKVPAAQYSPPASRRQAALRGWIPWISTGEPLSKELSFEKSSRGRGAGSAGCRRCKSACRGPKYWNSKRYLT